METKPMDMKPSEITLTDHQPRGNIQADMWECYYQAAIAEGNRDLRIQRISEAQRAILERAGQLEEGQGADSECKALEDAAERLRGLKTATMSDGISRDVEPADPEFPA